MYISYAVSGFTKDFIDNLRLQGDSYDALNVYGKPIYAHEESFEDVALSKDRVFQTFMQDNMIVDNTDHTKKLKRWAVYSWNREGLGTDSPFQDLSRQVMVLSDPVSGTSSTHPYKWVTLKTKSIVYSNTIQLVENIEEWVMMKLKTPYVIQADYGLAGLIDVNVSILKQATFSRFEEEKFGSVSSVGWESTLTFPIIEGAIALKNEGMILGINSSTSGEVLGVVSLY